MARSDLSGKNALIVGGSGGLGRSIAAALSEAGLCVAVHYHQDSESASRTRQEIQTAGGKAVAVSGDVTKAAEVDDIVAQARAGLDGEIDVLVYSAGVIPNNGGWLAETPDTLETAFSVNAMGAVLLAKAVYPAMRKAGWGRIINISTIYGDQASPWVLSYSMSKAALDAATKAISLSCAESNVTVNSIAPGNVDTEMTQRAGADYIASVEESTPLKRLGRPDEVAEAVLYLCRADFVTGAQLVIDGGLSNAG